MTAAMKNNVQFLGWDHKSRSQRKANCSEVAGVLLGRPTDLVALGNLKIGPAIINVVLMSCGVLYDRFIVSFVNLTEWAVSDPLALCRKSFAIPEPHTPMQLHASEAM